MNELETANNLSRSETNDENVAKKIVLPGQSPEGEHILSVLVKRTYEIIPDGVCIRAETDGNLIPGDVHYGDPMNSCVRYETDFVPYKPATDIVLNGKAYAPAGSSVRQLIATLAVGQFKKDILVTGDRFCIFQGGEKPYFQIRNHLKSWRFAMKMLTEALIFIQIPVCLVRTPVITWGAVLLPETANIR